MNETNRQASSDFITRIMAQEGGDSLRTLRVAVKEGFLLIGTVVPVDIHDPTAGQRTFSLEIGRWVSLQDEPNLEARPIHEKEPILRATDRVAPAVMCGLLGDYNYPMGQRTVLGIPLIDKPSARYGWGHAYGEEENTILHADPLLLQEVRKRGADLKGWVDIVDASMFARTQEPGHWYTTKAVETLGRVAITGLDLRADTRPLNYERYDLDYYEL